MVLPRLHHEDGLDLPPSAHYACTALYTHNSQVFQGITRKIRLGYPRDNYACNTLAIVSARMLRVPRDGGYASSLATGNLCETCFRVQRDRHKRPDAASKSPPGLRCVRPRLER